MATRTRTRLRQVHEYERMALPDLTREDAVLLAREWFDQFGEPPRARDWDMGRLRRDGDTAGLRRMRDGGWPSAGQVRQLFGAFSDYLIVAGFYPRATRPLWQATSLARRSYYLREAVAALKAGGGAGSLPPTLTALDRTGA